MKTLIAAAALMTVTIGSGIAQDMNYGEAEFLNSCAACHGVDAKGTGPLAEQLIKRPADLTTLSQRNGGNFPYAHVIAVIDGRYVVPGELINTGTAPGSTRRLKLVFRAGEQVLAERAMPLVEGPIAPGARRSFSLPLDEPPSGATNIVPTVD